MRGLPDHVRAVTAAQPTALYRFADSDGRLLYVGITWNLGARFHAHRSRSRWWSEQSAVSVEWFSSRDEAAEAELRAIHTEKPKYNVAGSRAPRATRTRLDAAMREAIAREVRGEVARYRSSRQAISELLGISRQSLSMRMRGKVQFRDDELPTLAEFLGVPPEQFAPRQVPA